MSLLEDFENNLLEIAAFKFLGCSNKSIMNILNLTHIKRQTFASYLLRQKDNISSIEKLNDVFFEELNKEYISHRNMQLILNRINSEFKLIDQEIKNTVIKKDEAVTNKKPLVTTPEKIEGDSSNSIDSVEHDSLIEPMQINGSVKGFLRGLQKTDHVSKIQKDIFLKKS